MAVSPALTYPSKTWKLRFDNNVRARFNVVASIRYSIVLVAGSKIIGPNLFYRATATLLQEDPSSRVRMSRTLIRRRRFMVGGLISVRGFPIPYLARVTTRPPYGEQWPRFAEYGSTI